jgi:hypothetical protein
MTESNQRPDYVFDGQYEIFPSTLNLLKQIFHSKQIKNKKIEPDGKVSIRGIFHFILRSTCPEKDAMNWIMKEICDQNDLDGADIQTDEVRTRYRNILDKFETTVDKKTDETITKFVFEVFVLFKAYFISDLVEFQQIDYSDIYAVFRFLQKIYTNWLEFSRQNVSKPSLDMIDFARTWGGTSVADFSKHLCTVRFLRIPFKQAFSTKYRSHNSSWPVQCGLIQKIHTPGASDPCTSFCTSSTFSNNVMIPVVFQTTGNTMTVVVASNATVFDIQQRFLEVTCSRARPLNAPSGQSPSKAESAAAAAAAALCLVITCNGRVLPNGEETLAEACRSAGAGVTIHVSVPLVGGMPNCLPPWMRPSTGGIQARPSLPAKGGANGRVLRSIGRAGIEHIVRELGQEAGRSSEVWQRKTFGGRRVASHDLRSVFMNQIEREDKTTAKVFPDKEPFHPQGRFPEHFSDEEFDVIITYTWLMCLATELPQFLDQIEAELEPVLGRKPRCPRL